jgi:signal peptidase I
MNYSVILFLATLALGLPWLIDKIYLAPKRRQAADKALEEFDKRIERDAIKAEPNLIAGQRAQLRNEVRRQPLWLEYTAGFFPVIAAVFFLRSFLFEPFKIPSGSMLPNLHVGDLILVNKYDYGIRLPVINKKIIELGSPQRGDVMVFRFPPDPSVDYIKRVIGVPGDTIEWSDQRLTVNGQAVALNPDGIFTETEKFQRYDQHLESLAKKPHNVLTDLNKKSQIRPNQIFIKPENCEFSPHKMTCRVPQGHYFMMGDNRDNSEDSRFWGFVPDENIVGRAFFIWMNFGNFSRIGSIK